MMQILAEGFIDSHCHLADTRMDQNRDDVIQQAIQKNIRTFIQAGVGPEDWQKQLELKKKFPENMIPCFGLHPYFVSDHSEEQCEQAFTQLKSALHQSLGLGECGLDFREIIVKGQNAKQIQFFKKQLELADQTHKVPVLHIVRAHDEAFKILKNYQLQRGFMVHAFSSKKSNATKYLDKGAYLSIGPSALIENNHALHESISYIPMDRLLIESDSPDPKPEPWTILDIAAKIATLKKLSAEQVLETARENLLQLFDQELKT